MVLAGMCFISDMRSGCRRSIDELRKLQNSHVEFKGLWKPLPRFQFVFGVLLSEPCTGDVVNLLEDRETNSKDLIAIFYNEFRPRYRQNTSFALTPLVFDFRRNLNKSRKDASSSLATDAALVGFIAQIWEVNAREDLMVTLDPSTRNPFAWLEWQFTSREDRLLCEMLEKEISEALIKAKNSMLKQLNEDRVRYPADTSRYDELLSKVNHFEAK
jgi:hypothetical protein